MLNIYKDTFIYISQFWIKPKADNDIFFIMGEQVDKTHADRTSLNFTTTVGHSYIELGQKITVLFSNNVLG